MCVHQSAHTSVLNHVTWPSQKPSPPTIKVSTKSGGLAFACPKIGVPVCHWKQQHTIRVYHCVSVVCKNDIMVMEPMNFGSFPALLTISSSFSNYFTNNYVDLLLKTNLVLTISPIILEYHYHHMINAHFSCKKICCCFQFPIPKWCRASRHWPAWNHAGDCHPEIEASKEKEICLVSWVWKWVFFRYIPQELPFKMENYRINMD